MDQAMAQGGVSWAPTRYTLSMKATGEHFAFVASARRATDGRFRFVWTLDAGKRGPGEHRHDGETEVFEVVSGTLRIWREGVPEDFGPGQRCTVGPGVRHRFLNPGTTPVVVRVSLDGPRMEDTLVPLAVATHGRVPRVGDMLRMVAGMGRPHASTPASAPASAAMHAVATLLQALGVKPFAPVQGWDAPAA